MNKYKILNLYACLGGNRYKWDEVADNLEITAVELDPEAARLYKERFPKDEVIVADAHEYLLDHYKEFDFIWSSPPCPSHSKVRITQKNTENFIPIFPDLKLYEEIIFLDNYFDGKYCVENVIPFYEPLIQAQKRGRHLYWTNFLLPNSLNEREIGKGKMCGQINEERVFLEKFHKIDLSTYKGKQDKRKMARNLVDYEAGKTILETALNIYKKTNIKQTSIFDEM